MLVMYIYKELWTENDIYFYATDIYLPKCDGGVDDEI